MFMIDLEAVMRASVGHQKESYPEHDVVTSGLFQGGLIDGDRRRLAFDQRHRVAIHAMHNDIGALRQIVQHQWLFNGDQ